MRSYGQNTWEKKNSFFFPKKYQGTDPSTSLNCVQSSPAQTRGITFVVMPYKQARFELEKGVLNGLLSFF
jgi:hypothetical protein